MDRRDELQTISRSWWSTGNEPTAEWTDEMDAYT
jgi:hypothetical protein